MVQIKDRDTKAYIKQLHDKRPIFNEFIPTFKRYDDLRESLGEFIFNPDQKNVVESFKNYRMYRENRTTTDSII